MPSSPRCRFHDGRLDGVCHRRDRLQVTRREEVRRQRVAHQPLDQLRHGVGSMTTAVVERSFRRCSTV